MYGSLIKTEHQKYKCGMYIHVIYILILFILFMIFMLFLYVCRLKSQVTCDHSISEFEKLSLWFS